MELRDPLFEDELVRSADDPAAADAARAEAPASLAGGS